MKKTELGKKSKKIKLNTSKPNKSEKGNQIGGEGKTQKWEIQ